MNHKKCLLGTLAAFVAMFATDWLLHGYFMMDAYTATASLWRTPAAMEQLRMYGMLGTLVFASAFACVFSSMYKGSGWMEGIKRGLGLGLVVAAKQWGMHIYMPIPANIAWGWAAIALVQGAVLGFVLSLVEDKA